MHKIPITRWAPRAEQRARGAPAWKEAGELLHEFNNQAESEGLGFEIQIVWAATPPQAPPATRSRF